MKTQLNIAIENELRSLEKEIVGLRSAMVHLKVENRQLSERLDELTAERAQLLNKNAVVQSRVEAMIARLKGLEQTT